MFTTTLARKSACWGDPDTTVVAWAPIIPGGSHSHYELLHETLWEGIIHQHILSHCSSVTLIHRVESANPGAKNSPQQPPLARRLVQTRALNVPAKFSRLKKTGAGSSPNRACPNYNPKAVQLRIRRSINNSCVTMDPMLLAIIRNHHPSETVSHVVIERVAGGREAEQQQKACANIKPFHISVSDGCFTLFWTGSSSFECSLTCTRSRSCTDGFTHLHLTKHIDVCGHKQRL